MPPTPCPDSRAPANGIQSTRKAVWSLTITAVGATDNGGTVVNNGTDVSYTPAAGFIGTEIFTYTLKAELERLRQHYNVPEDNRALS